MANQLHNCHIHLPPNFAAFNRVEQAVTLAAEQGVRVLGASNYYDFTVYGEFAAQTRKQGIFPLFGIEIIALLDDLAARGIKINDPGNPGKMYLCGKGLSRFEKLSPAAAALLQKIRANDRQRMARMVELLAGRFEESGVRTGLTEQAIKERIVKRHNCPLATVYLQERHVAQAFQEALFEQVPLAQRLAALEKICGAAPKAKPDEAVKIQNELRSHLMKAGKPGYVEEKFVCFEEAYRLVLELGGVPCYPVLADGTSPICGFEAPASQLAETLRARQIHCAEFIPLRNKPEVLTEYVTTLRKGGIVVTGGTEHNTLDLVPLAPACAGGAPIPQAVQEIFWEGTCVVAAHQSLARKGECGLVDGAGALNPRYDSSEARIAALRQIGAAEIEKHLAGEK